MEKEIKRLNVKFNYEFQRYQIPIVVFAILSILLSLYIKNTNNGFFNFFTDMNTELYVLLKSEGFPLVEYESDDDTLFWLDSEEDLSDLQEEQIKFLLLRNIVQMSLWIFMPLLIGLFIFNKKKIRNYEICPYEDCKKSVKIYEDWQCDKCNNHQGKDRYIFKKCVHCKQKLDSVYCEHCDREFIIKE